MDENTLLSPRAFIDMVSEGIRPVTVRVLHLTPFHHWYDTNWCLRWRVKETSISTPKPMRCPVVGAPIHIMEQRAAEGAAGYLQCWIDGHGYSLNYPGTCPYCGAAVSRVHLAKTACGVEAPATEQARLILDATLRQVCIRSNYGLSSAGDRKRKVDELRHGLRDLCVAPESIVGNEEIPVYTTKGKSPFNTITYRRATSWVGASVAHWAAIQGQVALRMRGLLPPPVPLWARASISCGECRDNALKSFDRIPSFTREKVSAWPEVGVDPRFGETTKAPMLAWGRCQYPCPSAHTRAVALQAARIMAARMRSSPPAWLNFKPAWLASKLNHEWEGPGVRSRRAPDCHMQRSTTISKPTTRVGVLIETTRAIIRSFKKHQHRKMAVGFRPGALNVKLLSRSEVDRLTAPAVVFVGEKVRELDFSSNGRAARLADCEGDKSTAGQAQLRVEEMTVTNAIVGDIEQGDAFDYEGNAPDPHGSTGRIVIWECDECWRRFEWTIDDGQPECCPHCESPTIREVQDRHSADTYNGEEQTASKADETEIPDILADAARLDGNLEELRNEHKTGLLQH